jgi:hypothetical protein
MKESDYFRTQAQECRSAAMQNVAPEDARALRQLARYYEQQAQRMEMPPSRH